MSTREYDIEQYINHIVAEGNEREELEFLLYSILGGDNSLKQRVEESLQEYIDINIHGTDID
tara:strand:- start:776 stop:961 length:186 start_codon:yes stop_codon:yes gene_type:complete